MEAHNEYRIAIVIVTATPVMGLDGSHGMRLRGEDIEEQVNGCVQALHARDDVQAVYEPKLLPAPTGVLVSIPYIVWVAEPDQGVGDVAS